ncbi:MAG: hypothetical protein JNN01_12335 [Opitutaceae bacterium]|nr:hypothetical protein [Opitutaceae bacterium]
MTRTTRWAVGVMTLMLAVLLGAGGAGAAEGAALPWIEDVSKVTAKETAWLAGCSDKLEAFARVTGVKVVVRLLAKSPTADEDKVPGAFMHALARRLAVDERGALVVYFADEKEFRVWIGDACAAAFVGQQGTAKEFTENGRMHEAKEAFLTAAETGSQAVYAAAQRAAPAGKPVAEALRVTLHVDAIVDGLIARLGKTPGK